MRSRPMTAFAMDHAGKRSPPHRRRARSPGGLRPPDCGHQHCWARTSQPPVWRHPGAMRCAPLRAFVIGLLPRQAGRASAPSLEGFVFQQGSYTQTHGCMGIMTACVHNPFDLGGVWAVVGLLDWQSIHVCADGNYRRPLAQLATTPVRPHPRYARANPRQPEFQRMRAAVRCSLKPNSGCT